jgi:hypothetical protein
MYPAKPYDKAFMLPSTPRPAKVSSQHAGLGVRKVAAEPAPARFVGVDLADCYLKLSELHDFTNECNL